MIRSNDAKQLIRRDMKNLLQYYVGLVFGCVAVIGCVGQPFEIQQENVGGGYEESFPPGNFPSSASASESSASTGVGGAYGCPTPVGTSSSISTGGEQPIEEPEIPIEEPEQPQDPKLFESTTSVPFSHH